MAEAVATSTTELAQAAGVGAEPIGRVETMAGTVVAVRADGSRVELHAGDSIFQGDTLESGPDGAVGVVLADDTTFSMAENGRMVMDEMVYDPGTQTGSIGVSVLQGVFTFVSGEIAKTDPDAMALHTPVATIGIRGTQVALSYHDGEELKLVLMQEKDGFVGEVVVRNAGGIQILNLADQGTMVANANTQPSPPAQFNRSDIAATFGGALGALPASSGGNTYGVEPTTTEHATKEELTQDVAAGTQSTKDEASGEDVAAAPHEGEDPAKGEQVAAEGEGKNLDQIAATLEQDFTTAAGGDTDLGGDDTLRVTVEDGTGDDVLVGTDGTDPLGGATTSATAGGDDTGGDDVGGDDTRNDPDLATVIDDAPLPVAEPDAESEPERESEFDAGFTAGSVQIGSSDDDVMTVGGGANILVGGAGDDTAVFGGNLADYEIIGANGAIAVRRVGSGDEATIMTGVETLQFADQSVSASDYLDPRQQAVAEGIDFGAAVYADDEGGSLVGGEGNDVLVGQQEPDNGSWGYGDSYSYYYYGGYYESDYAYEYEQLSGWSELAGEDGNDALVGGVGDNRLDGGAGDDILLAGTELNETVGEGYQYYAYDSWYGDYQYVVDYDWMEARSWAEQELSGGAGDDVLVGGAGANLLDGGAGDDVLVGGTGVATNESDTYYYTNYSSYDGTVSADWSDVEEVDSETWAYNQLAGDSGDDLLIGGAGSNFLDGGAGDDVLVGGTGEVNTYSEIRIFPDGIEEGYTHTGAFSYLGGGTGNDVVIAGDASTSGVDFTAYIGTGFFGAVGDFVESASFGEGGYDDFYDDDFFGFFAAESYGNGWWNWSEGLWNRDIDLGSMVALDGGAGNDVLIGGDGSDILYGGDDDGTGLNDDLASAQNIPRSTFGVSDNPELDDGSLPSVTVNGTLGGGGARDSDFFRVELQAGERLILDIDHGSTGGYDDGSVDTMLFLYDANGNQIDYNDDSWSEGDQGSVSGLDSHLDYTSDEGGVFYVAVTSYGNDPMDPDGGSGPTGTYVLNMSIEPTESSTGLGTDAPQAFADSETVIDAVNSDVLIGGGGSDLIAGGSGDDLLVGGEGADVFVFEQGDGRDTILDFGIDDALVFQGFSAEDVSVTYDQQTGVAVIGAGQGENRVEVTLQSQNGSGYSITENSDNTVAVTVDTNTVV